MRRAVAVLLCFLFVFLCGCGVTPAAEIPVQTGGNVALSAQDGVWELQFEFTGMTDAVLDGGTLYVGTGSASMGAVLYEYQLSTGTYTELYRSRFSSSSIYGLQLEDGQLVFYDSDALGPSQDLIHIDLAIGQSEILFSHTDESMFIGLPHTGGGYVSFLQLDNNVGDIALYLYQFGTGRSRIAATFPAASGSAYHGMTDEAVYWCDFSSGKAKIKCFSLETEETVSFPTAFARIENIAIDSGMVYAYAYPDKEDLTQGSVVCFSRGGENTRVLLGEVGWHFQPAGELLATFRNGQPLQLSRLSDGALLSIPELFPSSDCKLSADGRSLLVPTGENTLSILDLEFYREQQP